MIILHFDTRTASLELHNKMYTSHSIPYICIEQQSHFCYSSCCALHLRCTWLLLTCLKPCGSLRPDGGCHCSIKDSFLLVIITQPLLITQAVGFCTRTAHSRETSLFPLQRKGSVDCLQLSVGFHSAVCAVVVSI